MTRLNLDDIQGNILRGYGFVAGIHTFIEFATAEDERCDVQRGRHLLRDLLPRITTARPWTTRRPIIVTNVSLTFNGLKVLGTDDAVLKDLPQAFSQPIRDRAVARLGDTGVNAPDHWPQDVGTPRTHLLVVIASSEPNRKQPSFAESFPQLAKARQWLDEVLACRGARCLHRQEVQALPHQREHFGFADGFGQPAIEGMPNNWPGQGVAEVDWPRWRDIKAGEFVLGYRNEDGELVSGPASWLLRDGSYLVYRKLEQDVDRFEKVVAEQAKQYVDRRGLKLDDQAAFELMAAKLAGRWRDGVATELMPERERIGDLRRKTSAFVDNDFRYDDDANGFRCPKGAHVRRANPRDALAYQESRRHRIIRRGMPYDERSAANGESSEATTDEGRGLIFMCFNADIERQFETVQAQWCNDGNAFGLGDDRDFLFADRDDGKVTIEGAPPFFGSSRAGLVRTRGCEYLLTPGLSALHRLSAPLPYDSGLESEPVDEAEATSRVIGLVTQEMRRSYAATRPMLRGQHPKSHGCVKAQFTVAEGIPHDLRWGLFAEPGRSYEAWIRFSASHTSPQSDRKADAHGMSIKLLGVGGEKILPRERWAATQDFILVNYEVFFLRTARDVAGFGEAVTPIGGIRQANLQLRATEFFLRRRDCRGLRNLYGMLHSPAGNPLALSYWGQTPFALGRHAVKYRVQPVAGEASPVDLADTDALEDAMEESLRRRGARFQFDFSVQRQADPASMPVEDPTVKWSERDAPYRRVATITIEHQNVTAQERRNFGERLVFTPWHARWEHRPLGGINRLRRSVYEASSELRRDLNGAWPREPGGTVPSADPPHLEPGDPVPDGERQPASPARAGE
ncbi:MAG: hypothetical protein WAL63_09550 [Solirubrobacteraceae bacterium]